MGESVGSLSEFLVTVAVAMSVQTYNLVDEFVNNLASFHQKHDASWLFKGLDHFLDRVSTDYLGPYGQAENLPILHVIKISLTSRFVGKKAIYFGGSTIVCSDL